MAAALVLVTAVLAGAHGGDQARIHGCVAPSGGLRIIGSDETCKSNERALDWSVDGDSAGAAQLQALRDELREDDPEQPAPNDADGLVHWNNLEGVPGDLTDGDADLWSELRGIPADLADGDDVDGGTGADLACAQPTGCVSESEIAGKLTGHTVIADASISSRQLARWAVTGENLAPGAVETDRMTPNLATGNLAGSTGPHEQGASFNVASVVLPLPISGFTDSSAADHHVLLSGQSVVECACPLPDDEVEFTYQLTANNVPFGPAYPAVAQAGQPLSIAITGVDLVVRTGQNRTYALRVSVNRTTPGASLAVRESGQLTALDLGRTR
ncbi:MAG: hypothetical protein WB767_11320 [Nocardioides sp.]